MRMAEDVVPFGSGWFYDFFKPDGIPGAEADEMDARTSGQSGDGALVSNIALQMRQERKPLTGM